MNFISDRRSFLKGSASLSLVSSSRALRAIGTVLSATDSATASFSATIGHPLLVPNLSHSLSVRCLSKPVLATNMLDDMETDKGWTASPVVQLSHTSERARSGTRSLRFTTLVRNEEYIRASRNKQGSFSGDEAAFIGQPFSAFAALTFDPPQDWTAFNRISLSCYLHPTVTPTTSLSLQFLCAGATAGPWDPLPIHFIGDLKPGEWNHLTWEISEYPRNQVVAFFLMKPTSGLPLRTDDPSITFDFDQLSLERVEVEPVSSWQVTPGKIWAKCAGSDRAVVGLREQWRKDLLLTRKNCGIDSVRCHGLFDDEMGIASRGAGQYNFLYVDQIYVNGHSTFGDVEQRLVFEKQH